MGAGHLADFHSTHTPEDPCIHRLVQLAIQAASSRLCCGQEVAQAASCSEKQNLEWGCEARHAFSTPPNCMFTTVLFFDIILCLFSTWRVVTPGFCLCQHSTAHASLSAAELFCEGLFGTGCQAWLLCFGACQAHAAVMVQGRLPGMIFCCAAHVSVCCVGELMAAWLLWGTSH